MVLCLIYCSNDLSKPQALVRVVTLFRGKWTTDVGNRVCESCDSCEDMWTCVTTGNTGVEQECMSREEIRHIWDGAEHLFFEDGW